MTQNVFCSGHARERSATAEAAARANLFVKVEVEEGGHVGHALAKANFRVVVGVRSQHLEKPPLARAVPLPIVDIVAQRPVDVEVDLAFVGVGRRPLRQRLVYFGLGGILLEWPVKDEQLPQMKPPHVGDALVNARLELWVALQRRQRRLAFHHLAPFRQPPLLLFKLFASRAFRVARGAATTVCRLVNEAEAVRVLEQLIDLGLWRCALGSAYISGTSAMRTDRIVHVRLGKGPNAVLAAAQNRRRLGRASSGSLGHFILDAVEQLLAHGIHHNPHFVQQLR